MVLNAFGEVHSIKKLKTDGLPVETATIAHGTKLLKLGYFEVEAVTVEIHRTLNKSREVITERELAHQTKE